MAQFKDETIKNVVGQINETYFIPDIQREYVWLKNANEKKIELLFDSLLRGYPISSFLIWKLKKTDIETAISNKQNFEKINIQLYKFLEKYDERKTHNEKINIEQVNSNDLFIILDGQQRLTSLYIGLKGSRTLRKKGAWVSNPSAYVEKKLYLNLKYLPNYENPDDNYEFLFLSDDEYSNKDNTKHWFKVGEILNMDINDVITYLSENSLGKQEASILSNLHKAFCTDYKISYFEENDKQLEKVLKIFIRVNSGGSSLSYSDLLMSILTANFSSDIREMMNNLVDSLRADGFGIMGRDQILKTCLLLTDSPHVFILRNFKKENINKIEEKWDKIQNSIFKATKLLAEYGYRNQLSSGYIVTAIAYFYFLNDDISDIDKNEMIKFVRNAQIKGYFTNSVDGKLSTISNLIKNNKIFSDINNQLSQEKNNRLRIDQDDIEDFMNSFYGSLSTFAILQVLYPNLDYKNRQFHIDHIYPKSKFNKRNKSIDTEYIARANELFNLQLLEGKENNEKRAKDPEVWINEEFKTKEKITEYKKRNYIKEDLELKWENINEFEISRNNLIKEKLIEFLL